MSMIKIIKDSLKYPFRDVKGVLLLGILILLSGLSGFSTAFGNKIPVLIFVLGIVSALIGIFVMGYLFRVFESPQETKKIPSYNYPLDIMKNGLKFFAVILVYLTPALLILLYFTVNFYGTLFGSTFGTVASNPLSMIGVLLGTLIWPGILNLIGILYNTSLVDPAGIYGLIAVFYILVVIPVIFAAVVNMSRNNRFSSAFKIKEIITTILRIGILKTIVWYAATGFIFLIILIIAMMFTSIFSVLIHPELGALLLSLIVIPYLYTYLARSVALIFLKIRNH